LRRRCSTGQRRSWHEAPCRAPRAVHATEEWIDDLQERLGWHDWDRVYSAFLATLHAFVTRWRDKRLCILALNCPLCCMGPTMTASIGANPAKPKGIHRAYPGWRASRPRHRCRAGCAHRSCADGGGLLTGELEDAKAAMPRPLHNLWPS
jgi:hypothetical protein